SSTRARSRSMRTTRRTPSSPVTSRSASSKRSADRPPHAGACGKAIASPCARATAAASARRAGAGSRARVPSAAAPTAIRMPASHRISGAAMPSTCSWSPYSVMKKMSPTIPAGVAVMFNPLAAGLSWAASIPGTGPRDRVVILGAGQRGLCCVIAARAAGARQVVITGLTRDGNKLALARELGAAAAIDVEKNDVVWSVRDAMGGGAEVVVDTTPYAPQSLNHAVAIAVRKGRIVVAGLKGLRPAQDFAVDDVIYKELTIRGVLSMPVDE